MSEEMKSLMSEFYDNVVGGLPLSCGFTVPEKSSVLTTMAGKVKPNDKGFVGLLTSYASSLNVPSEEMFFKGITSAIGFKGIDFQTVWFFFMVDGQYVGYYSYHGQRLSSVSEFMDNMSRLMLAG